MPRVIKLRDVLSAVTEFCGQTMAVVFPGRCTNCGVATVKGAFCPICEEGLRTLENRSQCVQCGAPLALDAAPCQRCLGRGYRLFEQVVNLGVFADPLKPLIHRMKYYHGWPVGEVLAERCARHQRFGQLMAETDVLIPVPLHGWRQVLRGFNQAHVVADRFGSIFRKPVRSAAIRLRSTAAQSHLSSHDARVRNMRDAFALTRPRVVRNRRITLVDDVMTTGATLKALARVLKAANPRSINVMTLAIADPTGHSFEAV